MRQSRFDLLLMLPCHACWGVVTRDAALAIRPDVCSRLLISIANSVKARLQIKRMSGPADTAKIFRQAI